MPTVKECPICGTKYTFIEGQKLYQFCPYDGAELVSLEEAERQRQAAGKQRILPVGSDDLQSFLREMV